MSDRNIVLTGFMGTGKTSVGKILSKKLGRPLFDTDTLIEQREKRKISQIFRDEGETYFRAVEREVIREISQKRGSVITTGGGAVLDGDNIELLRERGVIILLKATADTIYKRVKNSKHRPLLSSSNLKSEISRLLEHRKHFYDNCDISFDTDGLTSAQVAQKIMGVMPF